MAKKKAKLNVFGLVMLLVILVSLIMTIVGICIAWTATTVESSLAGASKTSTSTLAELLEANANAKELGAEGNAKLEASAAFAIITVVLAGLTLISYALKSVLNLKIVKLLTLILSLALVVCAVITLITTFTFAGSAGSADLGAIVKGSTAPGAGAWLLAVFGIVGGAAGTIGCFAKN